MCPIAVPSKKMVSKSGNHEITTFDFLFRPLKTDFRLVAALCDY